MVSRHCVPVNPLGKDLAYKFAFKSVLREISLLCLLVFVEPSPSVEQIAVISLHQSNAASMHPPPPQCCRCCCCCRRRPEESVNAETSMSPAKARIEKSLSVQINEALSNRRLNPSLNRHHHHHHRHHRHHHRFVETNSYCDR